VTEPAKAAAMWAEALSSPDHDTDALDSILADDITTVSALGTTDGKAAVLASFGQSPIARLFTSGSWSEPSVDGATATMTCTFPTGAPVGGVTVTVTVNDAGRVHRVETAVTPAPPPVATAVQITTEMASAVNGALANGTPVTVAYVDSDGQPHLSLRGTVQAFSDDELAMWIRSPEGGLLTAITTNPRLALMYRSPQTRTTYQFHGRARVEGDEALRTQVFDNSPEQERNFDPQRAGVAVVVELDRVEGREASGPIRMIRPRT
jgi:hypothetical protein